MSRFLATGSLIAGIALSTTAFADEPLRTSLTDVANDAFNVTASTIADIPVDRTPGRTVFTVVPFNGVDYVLRLDPHSVRTADYELVVQTDEGLQTGIPGPERTVRGTVIGLSDSLVVGSIMEDGLYARVVMGDRAFWIEPIKRRVEAADDDDHIIYEEGAVQHHDGTCGVADEVRKLVDEPIETGGGGGACIAELACDADFEYYRDYGSSVSNVEARINLVINTVNSQYESQVGISHQISAIVVRATSGDPYTKKPAEALLCEFITEWTDNQQAISRDVAHLFTGRRLAGSTIGIAADIGNSGICTTQGACTGGTYGPLGSYCLAQSDFNGNFNCTTDLTAHELGHLWGAFHCSCSGATMNASITCANTFSAGTINSISNYRDSRSCLDNCSGGPTPTGACCNGGSCTVVTATDCSNQGGVYQGDNTGCSGNPCGPATGACCNPDDTCTVLTATDCSNAGGTYNGDNTGCSPNPCGGPSGAPIQSASVSRGSVLAGFLESLYSSDDDTVDIDAQRQGQRYRVDLQVVLASAFTNPSRLDVTTEVGANATGVTTEISLRNYATNSWDVIDSYSQPTSDTVRANAITSNAGAYVSASGEIQVRVFMQKSGGDYIADIDLVEVLVTP